MSDADPREAITMYSDYVCPFCFLGRTSLSRYLASRDEPLEVDWHPYDLRARRREADGTLGPPVNDGKDEAYYADARRNVRRLQERYDVEMAQEIATDVDSFPAQVASYHVKETIPGRWADFDAAVFDALWKDGRDIGDVDVLAELAEACDLDPDEIRGAVDDQPTRDAVRRKFEAAREAGITGVPTFVYGEHAARGAVPPEQLARLAGQ